MEEECDGAGCAGEKTADTTDDGDETEEEGTDGEEKANEDESEHEARFEVVFRSTVEDPLARLLYGQTGVCT